MARTQTKLSCIQIRITSYPHEIVLAPLVSKHVQACDPRHGYWSRIPWKQRSTKGGRSLVDVPLEMEESWKKLTESRRWEHCICDQKGDWKNSSARIKSLIFHRPCQKATCKTHTRITWEPCKTQRIMQEHEIFLVMCTQVKLVFYKSNLFGYVTDLEENVAWRLELRLIMVMLAPSLKRATAMTLVSIFLLSSDLWC